MNVGGVKYSSQIVRGRVLNERRLYTGNQQKEKGKLSVSFFYLEFPQLTPTLSAPLEKVVEGRGYNNLGYD